ncbi:MAG: replication-associated recombination protein A [Puniceicoccaceae bacterium]
MSAEQQSMFDAPPPESDPQRPLAARMRPSTLEEIVGQPHLVAPDSMLRKMLAKGRSPNLIIYGPPGTGKTTLATVISNVTGSKCFRLNAVASNVAELREVLQRCRVRKQNGQSSLLFIDEIHRFNKSQQDLLLPDVEEGNVTLIGATTHNPGFYVNPPLLSRCHLIRLEPLDVAAIVQVLQRALADDKLGLGGRKLQAGPAVLRDLAQLVGGDLRQALNTLELIADFMEDGAELTEAVLRQYASERKIRYDANEDEHYDTASAFIKSIRGGDPDAALYWMCKMLLGGEDPRFIARRLVILASEDVGMADSRALPVAMACFQACEVIGQPECEINLAHATVFLATSPKSNRAYEALHRAKAEIQAHGVQAVPLWLRDKGGMANKAAGHSKDYRYSHEFPEAISGQDYMLEPKQFYFPKSAGSEAGVIERLERWRSLKAKLRQSSKD